MPTKPDAQARRIRQVINAAASVHAPGDRRDAVASTVAGFLDGAPDGPVRDPYLLARFIDHVSYAEKVGRPVPSGRPRATPSHRTRRCEAALATLSGLDRVRPSVAMRKLSDFDAALGPDLLASARVAGMAVATRMPGEELQKLADNLRSGRPSLEGVHPPTPPWLGGLIGAVLHPTEAVRRRGGSTDTASTPGSSSAPSFPGWSSANGVPPRDGDGRS